MRRASHFHTSEISFSYNFLITQNSVILTMILTSNLHILCIFILIGL